jgi:hypothetical protein
MFEKTFIFSDRILFILFFITIFFLLNLAAAACKAVEDGGPPAAGLAVLLGLSSGRGGVVAGNKLAAWQQASRSQQLLPLTLLVQLLDS